MRYKNIFFSIGISLIVILTSCSKDESKDVIKQSPITNPNIKTEFVNTDVSDWQKIEDGLYQLCFESDIINTYKSISYVKVYKRLSKYDLGQEGIWEELPWGNYDYEYVNEKIYIHSYNEDSVNPCMFKLEIKLNNVTINNNFESFADSENESVFQFYDDMVKTQSQLQEIWSRLYYYNQKYF